MSILLDRRPPNPLRLVPPAGARGASPQLRVALINEGTYPFIPGGVSVWCDQLLRGLSEHAFRLVTIVGTDGMTPAYDLPPCVRSLQAIPLWGLPPVRVRVPAESVRAASEALAVLFGALVQPTDLAVSDFERALRRLAVLARRDDLRACLQSTDPASLLLDAVQQAGVSWPKGLRLSLHDALAATELIEHALYLLAVELPPVDVCHVVSNGLAVLIGLTEKWHRRTPLIISEHGIYLRERYLDHSLDVGYPSRLLLLRFHHLLARVGYSYADRVAPCTRFNLRWAVRCGADPTSVKVISNGIDLQRYRALKSEPGEPTLVWVGRIDPLKDLRTLIEAFALVAEAVPDALLRLFGPVPAGNEAYEQEIRQLVEDNGLAASVRFEGPVDSSREAFATGQIVVLSSMSEGLPYTVIEAMMCKRPVVATDVGGVAEAVGGAGIIVPPQDPVALAAACVELLYDAARRRRLGELAARRSRAKFRVGQVTGSFRAMYATLAPDAAHRRVTTKFRRRGEVRYRTRHSATLRVLPRWAVARR